MTPLRILYVGNFTRPWCTEVHVSGSLKALGHDVSELQENTVNWAAIPRLARSRRADLLLWTRTWDVDHDACLSALAALQAQGVPSVSYHLDRWWGLEREYQILTEPFFRTSMVFSPDGDHDDDWRRVGVNHRWLPPGVYHAECGEWAPDLGRFPEEVVFVGSYPYPHPDWAPYREQLVEGLRSRLGDRFRVWPGEGTAIRGAALGTLYASAKIVVGDSCLANGARRYWSDRIPETLGRGAFLIHPEVDGLDEWYENGVDFVTYPVGDFDRLHELVDYYLTHDAERQAIAAHGRATVLGRDTYQHRMSTVIEMVREDHGLGIPRVDVNTSSTGAQHAVRHLSSHQRAVFEVAQGDTDLTALHEVWNQDTYKVTTQLIDNGLVVDIGANVGAFTVLAAKLGARRVLAFEPQKTARERLVANLRRNTVDARVTVREEAVRGTGGEVSLVGDGGGATVTDDAGGVTVAAVSIDDVLAPLTDVSLMKIDCEGSEFSIIDGVDPANLVKVHRIVMEFHGPGMPHLTHLMGGPDFGRLVTKLAGYGRLDIFGRPDVGGLLWWTRY